MGRMDEGDPQSNDSPESAPASDDAPSDDSFRGAVTLVRHSVKGWAALTLAIALALAGVLMKGLGADAGILLIVLGVTVALLAQGEVSEKLAGVIVADARGVRMDGKEILPRAAMHDGFVEPRRSGRHVVKLVGRAHVPIATIAVETAARGEELLRALKLDVLHATFESVGRCHVGKRRWRARVLVTADGVLARPGEFYPYGEIERVTLEGLDVVLHRIEGAPLRLTSHVERGALSERIREGLEAFRRRTRIGDVSVRLARGRRTVGEWMAALRALTRPSDYRTGPVPDETLWRIAEDPALSASMRAAAATALGVSIDTEGRARLRKAAATSESPRIRVALEAAASSEDDELARALEECAEREQG